MKIRSFSEDAVVSERLIENCGNLGAESVVVFLDDALWDSPSLLTYSLGNPNNNTGIVFGIDPKGGNLRGLCATLLFRRVNALQKIRISKEIRTGIPVFDTKLWQSASRLTDTTESPCVSCWTSDGRFAVELSDGSYDFFGIECVVSPDLSVILSQEDDLLGVVFGNLDLIDRIVLEQGELGYLERHAHRR